MQYTVIITHADGRQTRTHTNATNGKQAHEHATNGNTTAHITPTATDSIRAYPTTATADGSPIPYNILRGALQVAKRSAEKTEGGTPTQERIARELKNVNAKAGKPEAESLGIPYIYELIEGISADSNDFIGYAYKGIIEAMKQGEPIEEQYHQAYLHINSYINAQRTATDRERSTEYITAEGGAIVTINQYVSRIIKNGERYTPIDNGIMDSDTADRLGEAIAEAMSQLTPRQKNVIKLIAEGYSIPQTAEKLNIKSVGTVEQHLANVRAKTLQYFEKHHPEFIPLIDVQQVKAIRTNRHTKEYQREYMKQYRARKAAIKAAQK